MVTSVRAKRVSDPLDDRVKTSLCCWSCPKTGYESSGSEHEADSALLGDLIHGFTEEEEEEEEEEDSGIFLPETTLDFGQEEFPVEEVLETLKELVNANANANDRLKCELRSLVSQAFEAFSGEVSSRAVLRRAVTKRLRDSGYNAGICKSKWESSGGVVAGSYEYIDVVIIEECSTSTHTRYLIDLDFAGEFEIARPSSQYSRIVQNLPRVFVGKSDELKRVIRAVCEAANKSLKASELDLPPWRRNRYMQAKWLGPYRRTLEPIPAAGKFTSPESDVLTGVKWRSVGFEGYAGNFDLM